MKISPRIFALTALSLGVFQNLLSVTVPLALTGAHYPPDAALFWKVVITLPLTWYFLWSPIVHVGLRPRAWVAVVSGVSAALVCIAFVQPLPANRAAFVLYMGLASGAGMLATCADGALMGEMGSLRSSAARWYQAGFVGGGAMGGAAISWTYLHVSRLAAGYVASLFLALPAVLYWRLPSGGRDPEPWGALFTVWRKLPRVVAGLVRQRFARTGVMMLLLPLNVGAAAEAFSVMAKSYNATSAIPYVNGLFGGVMIALGALASTFLFALTSVQRAYAAAGFLCSAAALSMGLGPVRPITYFVGCLVYLFFLGVGSAVTTALILEIQSEFHEMQGTIYAICCSAGNVPFLYAQSLNGLGLRAGGNRGLLFMDAMLNALGAGLCCALIACQRAGAVDRSGAGNVTRSGRS